MDQNDTKDDSTSPSQDLESDMNTEEKTGLSHGKTEVIAPSATSDIKPAEISTMETATVEAEVEPNTVAFTPDATQATPPVAASTDIASEAVAAPPTPATVKSGDKKRLLVIAAALILTTTHLAF